MVAPVFFPLVAHAPRWCCQVQGRLAIGLTIVMTVIYLAFILLIAYNKALLGTILVPGLSLGILLGRKLKLNRDTTLLISVGTSSRRRCETRSPLRRPPGGASG